MNAPEIISDSNSWFDSLLHQQRSADSYDDSDGSVHEPSESTYTSRYQTEFKQIALVGWGGGGEVWKVSHRLDRREYAVKKITLDPIDSALNDKTTREVTTISRLIHNNVVRYYAAWVEEGQKNSISSAVNTSTELIESDSSDSISNCVLSNDPFYSALNISNSDVLFADSTGNKCRENEYSEAVSVANSRNHSSTSPLSHAAEKSSQLPPPTRILYIQMEFCYATLQEAILDGKLWQYPMEVSRLFRQLLEATRYVHSMRVIHRDLKPANVFLDSSGNIKIGDFGLATTDRGYDLYGDIDGSCRLVGCNTPEPIATLESSLIDLTCGVGTALYRAPEQEACSLGCTPSSYSSKADIYSLGIILFEMCHAPFSTGMERIVTIKALREHRTLPGDFLAITPAYFESLILWLVENDPDKRPTAAEVLTSDLMQQATGHIDSSPVSQSSSCTSLGGTQVACKKPVVENVHVFQVHIPYMHLRVFGTWINQRSQVTETAFAEYVPFPETLSGYAVVFQELMADMCAAYEGKLFDESCTTSKSGLIYAALYSTVDQLYDMIIFSPSVLSELLHKDAK